MAKKNVARDVLWPSDAKILVRVAFLHVGQGASAVVFVKDSDVYRVVLVDINLDRKVAGIDVPRMMKDLLDGQSLEAFCNTHPHDDHLCGTKELSDAVDIKAVWHSNHKPSKKYGSKHPELTDLIKKVTKKYGNAAEVIIEKKDSPIDYGEAQYDFLHPTEHLTDEVNDEQADERRKRIHEQCGVIKFGEDNQWIIIVGDADRCAFKDHIVENLKNRLKSFCLGASHHGSDTFFRENEDQDEYMEGLEAIDPEYTVVSAPTQGESKYEHPCDFAMDKYEDQCGDENVFHTGEDRYTFVFDIFIDGTHGEPKNDGGQLVDEYGLDEEDGGDDGNGESKAEGGYFVAPREQAGEYQPRKYG
jgi:beta-lactamase superfamily II metal-dependent hydrolase